MTRAGEKLYQDPAPPRDSFVMPAAFRAGIAVGLVGFASAIVTIVALLR
jgi:hypothetical protein